MRTESKLAKHLTQVAAFRIEDLPTEVRQSKYLSQRLHVLEKRGAIRRVRRGAYIVTKPSDSSQSDRFVVASLLVRPYAVSFYSALELRGLAESVSRRVMLQSPKRQLRFGFEGVEYRSVSGRVDFGIDAEQRGGVSVQVTDIERTILDCLRYPRYAGGADEFIRALSGVQKHDLLSVVLERSLTSEQSPPDWMKLRAELERRRPELNDLVEARLLSKNSGHVVLTAAGLLLCPDDRALEIRRSADLIITELRRRYREDPRARHQIQDLSKTTGVSLNVVRIIILALQGTSLFTGYTPNAGGWPDSVSTEESVLDYESFEHIGKRLLEQITLPSGYVSSKVGIAYIRPARLMEYLNRFREGALFSKSGFLLTFFQSAWAVPEDMLTSLRRRIPARKYYWPPSLAKGTGKLVKEWNLIVPAHLHSRYVMAAHPSKEPARGVV